MRVLHLIPTLGFAGAERQLAYLGAGLQRLGFEVHVGTLVGDEEEAPLTVNRAPLLEAGVQVWQVPSRGSYDPRIPFGILRLVRRLKPDLLQTWIPMMDVLGGMVARLSGVPWVLAERNTPDFFPAEMKFRLRLALARRCASAIVSNSESGGDYWARHAPRVPRYVVRNALPLDRMNGALPSPAPIAGLPAEGPLVLAVGRFKLQKNVWNLLEALEKVVRRTGAHGLVCGEGYVYPDALRRIHERGLDGRIFAPGFVADVWSWMKRAQVFVSVSRFEGMPNAVMEAMACGCPLVLSDIPMHREIVGRDGALFVDLERPEEIADAIVSVLADPEGARARADAARKAAAAWSIEAAASRYAEIYRAVAGRGGRPPR